MIEQRRSKTNCIHVFRVSIDCEYRSFVKQRLPSACKNSQQNFGRLFSCFICGTRFNNRARVTETREK